MKTFLRPCSLTARNCFRLRPQELIETKERKEGVDYLGVGYSKISELIKTRISKSKT